MMTCNVFGDVVHVLSRLELNDFPFMSSAARRRVLKKFRSMEGSCEDGIGLRSCPVAGFEIKLNVFAAQHQQAGHLLIR